jgi:hypothetical protein
VHVDDFLSTGTPKMVAELRQALATRFKTTGEIAHTHYGLDIARRNKTYKLGCHFYIERELEAYSLTDTPIHNTPMPPWHQIWCSPSSKDLVLTQRPISYTGPL